MFVVLCMVLFLVSGAAVYAVLESSKPHIPEPDWEGALKVAGVSSAFDKLGMGQLLLTTSPTTMKRLKLRVPNFTTDGKLLRELMKSALADLTLPRKAKLSDSPELPWTSMEGDTTLPVEVSKSNTGMQRFMPPAGPIRRRLRPIASRRNMLVDLGAKHILTSSFAPRRKTQRFW